MGSRKKSLPPRRSRKATGELPRAAASGPVPGLPAPRRRPSRPPEVRRPAKTATAGHFFLPRLISGVGASRRREAGVAPAVGDGSGTSAGGFDAPSVGSAASAVGGGAPSPSSSPFLLPLCLLGGDLGCGVHGCGGCFRPDPPWGWPDLPPRSPVLLRWLLVVLGICSGGGCFRSLTRPGSGGGGPFVAWLGSAPSAAAVTCLRPAAPVSALGVA
jgi:hypothetical protein